MFQPLCTALEVQATLQMPQRYPADVSAVPPASRSSTAAWISTAHGDRSVRNVLRYLTAAVQLALVLVVPS